MNFTEKLLTIQKTKDSFLCIGLDTDPRLLPTFVSTASDPVLTFNRLIIEATHDLVCAYKINLAFYEALGERGWIILRKTLSFIPDDVITIGDGKRGDIGNTAERYASALFGELGFDAVTLNPYMGFDSVEPFVRDPGRGAFILALTSNPGSKDFQRLKVGTKKLYERVVVNAKKWNRNGNIGLVVGATHSSELRRIRNIAPTLPLLIPGIGAQGGDLRSAVRYGCTKDGTGAIINVSRSIIYASALSDFADASRREALRYRDEIRSIHLKYFK